MLDRWTDEELDKFNSAISKRAIEENIAAPLTTKIRGMVVLRICAVSPELDQDEMREIIRDLDRIASSLCAT